MWKKIKKFFGWQELEILPAEEWFQHSETLGQGILLADLPQIEEVEPVKKKSDLLTTEFLTKLKKDELLKLAKKRFSLRLKLAETKKQMIDKILTKQLDDAKDATK